MSVPAARREARPRLPTWLHLAGILSLATLCIGLAAALAPAPVAAAARAALAGTCHQRSERSLAIGSAPLGACARCTGLHASGVAGLALAVVLGAARMIRRRQYLARATIVAVLVLAVDVAAGMAWPGWDHPWIRLATGLAAGALLACSGAAVSAQEALPRRAFEAAA